MLLKTNQLSMTRMTTHSLVSPSSGFLWAGSRVSFILISGSADFPAVRGSSRVSCTARSRQTRRFSLSYLQSSFGCFHIILCHPLSWEDTKQTALESEKSSLGQALLCVLGGLGWMTTPPTQNIQRACPRQRQTWERMALEQCRLVRVWSIDCRCRLKNEPLE